MDWNTYKEQANALRSKGVLPSQIKEQLGPPIFDGEEWHIESDGKGGIKRKRKSARQAGKRKSTATRNQKATPKTEGEAAYLRKTQAEARVRSQSTLHQHAYNTKPSIAEHDVRIASGGTNEYMSISDPNFKEFKDNIESRLPKGFTADIDDVSGGVRVIPTSHHNKFQPTSRQIGATFEAGIDNLSSVRRLQVLAKKLGIPLVGGGFAALMDLASGGNVASAAGAFIDAENPIDGGAVSAAGMDEPQRVAARRQQLQQQRKYMSDLVRNTGNQVLNYLLFR